MKENDYAPEDSAYVRETFAECNVDPQEDFLFIQPGSLRFYKDYCFPHVYRGIDDNLDIEVSIKSVEKYLSATGRKILVK